MFIGLAGFSRVGKDTAADVLVSEYGFKRFAYADLLKAVLRGADPIIDRHGTHLSYLYKRGMSEDQIKLAYPEYVRLLRHLGTEGIKKNLGSNVFVSAMTSALEQNRVDNCAITDVRFLVELYPFDVNGRTHNYLWHVTRPGRVSSGHASEQMAELCEAGDVDSLTDRFNIDGVVTLHNDGTVEQFKTTVRQTVESVLS